MENINLRSIYKLASIKWLLVTLLAGISGGISASSKDKGYIAIISSKCSFTAIKANGESFTWGSMGGASGPYNGAVY